MAKKVQQINEHPKVPFPVGDRAAYIRRTIVTMDIVHVPTYEAVTWNLAYDRVEVIRLPVSEVDDNFQTRKQFYVDGQHVVGGPNQLAKTHASWLRNRALICGATPDAIRLLSKVTGAFTKKEEVEMAEKLKTKAAPKKADAKALKSAAAKTPVGGKKPRGNADVLKKAREAKGPDLRKIKALKKVKEIEARAGTYRNTMLTNLLAAKTVQEFRDKGHSAGDLRYAQEAGYIEALPAR